MWNPWLVGRAHADGRGGARAEERLERPISLNGQRRGAVVAALRASGARRILDLGCGEGKLIRELLGDRQFEDFLVESSLCLATFAIPSSNNSGVGTSLVSLRAA